MTTPTEPTYVVVEQPAPPQKRRVPRAALFAIVALLLAGAGAGTFASFSASTTNSSTFATGTLVLSNKVNSNTTCFSTGVATNTDVNDNTGCDALYTTANALPGSTATVNLTLKNEGSLDATALSVWAASACANTTNAVATYTGTGNLCNALQLTIQEYSDPARTTVSNCRYGNAAVTNTCDFGDTTKVVGGTSGQAFGFLYPSAGSSLGLGSLASQATRYFTIGVKVPLSADNTMQGRVAGFALKWSLS